MSAAKPPASQLLPAFTLAVWTSCAVVGGLGLVLHYARPSAPAPEPEPVVVPLLTAETPKEPEPPTPEEPDAKATETPSEPPPATAPPVTPPDAAPPPPAPPPLTPPNAPAFTAVAAPDAAVAFAVPVAGEVRVVPRELADPGRRTGSEKGVVGGTGIAPEGVSGGTGNAPVATPGTGAPQAQDLVFGQGEGAQAKPDYPREAQRRRQEGTVRIRFEVDETGAVTHAEVEEGSPFPLLNQAALSTVKRSWRFPTGAKRLYTVAIKFVLQ